MSNDDLTRRVWEVREEDFPDDAPVYEQARFLLKYAILAPSSHNSQPWEFEIDGSQVELHADEARWLRVADPNRRELFLSVGCALENLIIAAQHFDKTPSVKFVSGASGPAVVVDVGADASSEPRRWHKLFLAITKRRTSHAHFFDRAPDDSFFDEIQELVYGPELDLHIITSSEAKRKLGEMQAEADEQQMHDEDYRRELGDWIGAGALGDSWPKARISKFVVTHFDTGKSEGAHNAEYIREAPAVALITSSDDSARSRIQAGQLYERIALAATYEGVANHPLSQMLEIEDHREALMDVVGPGDQVPQHFFRLGFARGQRDHTPRWPLERFLAE